MSNAEEVVLQKLTLKEIWDDAYYAGNRQISDATYDANKDSISELLLGDAELKAKYWDRFTATSYSRLENTGGDIKHDYPMMSLAKSNKLDLFFKELQKWKAAGSKQFVLMWKVDGGSSAYRYSDLVLQQVLTRHKDGFGKDLTATGYQIANLPKTLPEADGDHRYEVRGEMVIFEEDFTRLNHERELLGLDLYQNARNAAAGESGDGGRGRREVFEGRRSHVVSPVDGSV